MIKTWKMDVPQGTLSLAEEAALLRRAAEGDEEAMEMMLRKYAPLAMRAAHQPHLASIREDAEAEAMLSLVEAIRSYDPGRGVPFAGYARRKVTGDVRTFFRRERIRWEQSVVPFDGEDGESYWDSVPDERNGILDYEDAELVRAALACLSREEHGFLLRAMDPADSQAALARELGITRQAVAKRKKCLIEKIRRHLRIE